MPLEPDHWLPSPSKESDRTNGVMNHGWPPLKPIRQRVKQSGRSDAGTKRVLSALTLEGLLF